MDLARGTRREIFVHCLISGDNTFSWPPHSSANRRWPLLVVEKVQSNQKQKWQCEEWSSLETTAFFHRTLALPINRSTLTRKQVEIYSDGKRCYLVWCYLITQQKILIMIIIMLVDIITFIIIIIMKRIEDFPLNSGAPGDRKGRGPSLAIWQNPGSEYLMRCHRHLWKFHIYW